MAVNQTPVTRADRIADKIKGREQAQLVIALAELGLQSVAFQASFWEELDRQCKAHVEPLVAVTSTKDSKQVVPMTNQEAHMFGHRLVPYGEFKGSTVSCVDLERLAYYADLKNDFQQELKRYLLAPSIIAEREAESGTPDDEDRPDYV